MKLTEHFFLSEFEYSDKANELQINNSIPSFEVAKNINNLCVHILQPLRGRFGKCVVSSGFRVPAVNKEVGGSKSSSHLLGFAADISFPDADLYCVYLFILDSFLFDECFLYTRFDVPFFIHVSTLPSFRMRSGIFEIGK